MRTLLVRQAGFSILEALVTLVVVSAGLLGLAGLQTTLTREADASRQRGEATRLAQERIEAVRSFHQIASVSDPTADPPVAWSWSHFGWNDLPASRSDIIDYANTQYTRTLELGGADTDTLRPLRVTVSWTDRAGQGQSVILHSVIAKMESATSGGLSFTPPVSGATGIKLIKNRNMNIPFPAVNLGDGSSAYRLKENTEGQIYSIIFNNALGSVVKECTTTEAITTIEQASECTVLNGYVVAGYITRVKSGKGGNAVTPPWPEGISLAGINQEQIVLGSSKCILGPAIDQNDEITQIAGYMYYVCLMAVPKSGDPWSGTVRIAGLASADVRVCRIQFTSQAVTDDERNEQPYDEVRMSLDNQNYLVAASGAGACADMGGALDTPFVPLPSIATLELHQDCTAAASSETRNANCPAT